MDHAWLILPEQMPRLEGLLTSDVVATITAEQRDKLITAARTREEENPADLRVGDDGTAVITVSGPLMAHRSWILDLFGYEHTSYEEISSALAKAESDKKVKQLRAEINSPGGMVSGLFECLADFENFSKPKSATASLAASAAYAIAAQCGEIEASSPMATFGSIGVAAQYYVSDRVVDVTNTASPDKRPDPTTKKGQDAIQSYLDQIHGLFADAIAQGRGTTVAKVDADFGNGRVFLASAALERKMIDSNPHARGGENQSKAAAVAGRKGNTMTLEELKTQYPEVFKAAFAAGKEAGATKERSRVKAHLKMASKTVSKDAAKQFAACHGFIESGASVRDDEVFAEYQSAGLARRDVTARGEDEDEAAPAANKPAGKVEAEDADDRAVAAALEGLDGEEEDLDDGES